MGEVETSPKQKVAIVKPLEAIVKPLEIRPVDPDDDSEAAWNGKFFSLFTT